MAKSEASKKSAGVITEEGIWQWIRKGSKARLDCLRGSMRVLGGVASQESHRKRLTFLGIMA